MKKLTQADYDLLKARGKVLNGFNTKRIDVVSTPTKEVPVEDFIKENFKYGWSGSLLATKSNNSPAALQKMVIDKVKEVLDNASKIYKREFTFPKILFKKRGKVAGTANSFYNRLNFNMVLLRENTEEFLKQTVPHECAHLVADKVYGRTISAHGREWKRVMVMLGCEPKRCHSYAVTNSAVYEKEKFVYKCNCMFHTVGIIRHRKASRGVNYRCNKCKSRLSFVKNAGRVSHEEAVKNL